MQNKLRDLVVCSLAVVVLISVTLILGEAMMRIANIFKGRDRVVYLPDPFLGHRHASNNSFRFGFSVDVNGQRSEKIVQQRTNNSGFVGGDNYIYEKEEKFRALVIGDSFTEAFQVPHEQKYTTLMQQRLFGGTKDIEVINAGVSGYSPLTMYAYYRDELKDFESDVVIVQLFANDVFEDHKFSSMSVLDEYGFPIRLQRFFTKHQKKKSRRTLLEKIHQQLVEVSRLYEYYSVKLYKRNKKSLLHRELTQTNKYNDGHQFFIVSPGEGLYQDAAFRQQCVLRTQQYLLGLNKLITAAGARMVVMMIPMEGQIEKDSYSPYTQMFMTEKMNRWWNDQVYALSLEYGFHFLDLLPVFQNHANENLYLPYDGHLTQQGHNLVANTLVKYIEQIFNVNN